MEVVQKVKGFYKDHENEIKVVACLAGTAVGVALLRKHFRKGFIDIRGKRALSWVQSARFMNYDEAKQILEANINGEEHFAILKEACSNTYSLLSISDNVVIPFVKGE